MSLNQIMEKIEDFLITKGILTDEAYTLDGLKLLLVDFMAYMEGKDE